MRWAFFAGMLPSALAGALLGAYGPWWTAPALIAAAAALWLSSSTGRKQARCVLDTALINFARWAYPNKWSAFQLAEYDVNETLAKAYLGARAEQHRTDVLYVGQLLNAVIHGRDSGGSGI